MIQMLNTDKKVVGTKEVSKALSENKVKQIYIAEDAEHNIINRLVQLSDEKQIEIIYIESMRVLGKACKIDVNAATAALLK